MATYILVHGGDRDGTIWHEVAQTLQSHGNKVFCPSMTSIKTSTLEQNIAEISSVIEINNLSNVILIGHSYGAMVITGVADKFANKIELMVFVDSAIPESGKALYEIFAEYGFNYRDLGLTPDQPCITPLSFDEKQFAARPKAYVHCQQSEFISLTKPIYQDVLGRAAKDNFVCFNLDTVHSCMLTEPKALAAILAGVQVLI